jgi:pheromone shutdown protein TraB
MQTHSITLISTVHKEIGQCNSNELYKIIESIKPDVIFLEAFENSYSKYQQMLFTQFEVYHERLEIKAIQAYSQNNTFEYVPVLDINLSDEFEEKITIVSENTDYQKILDNYTSLETDFGFQFLNSEKQIALQDEMRDLENRIIENKVLQQKSNESIDAYEHSMISNIYSFCKQNSFNKAIIMCGAGHRKTIIQKIVEYEIKETIKLNWTFYSDTK